MKYKNITTITIAVLVVILFFALLPQVVLVVGWAVSEHQETARSYPTRGTYYCQELETYLIFMDSSHTVQYADGSTDSFLIHYAGSFCGESTDFRAFYRWHQKKDQIILTIKEFPLTYENNKKYVFSSVEPR